MDKQTTCIIAGNSPHFAKKYGTPNPICTTVATDLEAWGDTWRSMLNVSYMFRDFDARIKNEHLNDQETVWIVQMQCADAADIIELVTESELNPIQEE